MTSSDSDSYTCLGIDRRKIASAGRLDSNMSSGNDIFLTKNHDGSGWHHLATFQLLLFWHVKKEKRMLINIGFFLSLRVPPFYFRVTTISISPIEFPNLHIMHLHFCAHYNFNFRVLPFSHLHPNIIMLPPHYNQPRFILQFYFSIHSEKK